MWAIPLTQCGSIVAALMSGFGRAATDRERKPATHGAWTALTVEQEMKRRRRGSIRQEKEQQIIYCKSLSVHTSEWQHCPALFYSPVTDVVFKAHR